MGEAGHDVEDEAPVGDGPDVEALGEEVEGVDLLVDKVRAHEGAQLARKLALGLVGRLGEAAQQVGERLQLRRRLARLRQVERRLRAQVRAVVVHHPRRQPHLLIQNIKY